MDSVVAMTRGQGIAGSLVIAATVLGCAFTAPWAERKFSSPASSAADSGKARASHTRTCVTVDGRRFEWNFPNPPFGTRSCSE